MQYSTVLFLTRLFHRFSAADRYTILFSRKGSDEMSDASGGGFIRSSSVPKDVPEDDPGSSKIYRHLEEHCGQLSAAGTGGGGIRTTNSTLATPVNQQMNYRNISPYSNYSIHKRKPSPLLGSVILAQKIQQERLLNMQTSLQTPKSSPSSVVESGQKSPEITDPNQTKLSDVSDVQSYPDLLNELPTNNNNHIKIKTSASHASNQQITTDQMLTMPKHDPLSPVHQSGLPEATTATRRVSNGDARRVAKGYHPIRRSASTVSDIQRLDYSCHQAVYHHFQNSSQFRPGSMASSKLFVLPLGSTASSGSVSSASGKPKRFSATSTASSSAASTTSSSILGLRGFRTATGPGETFF